MASDLHLYEAVALCTGSLSDSQCATVQEGKYAVAALSESIFHARKVGPESTPTAHRLGSEASPLPRDPWGQRPSPKCPASTRDFSRVTLIAGLAMVVPCYGP